jgi:NAD(P)H-hydrate epimerase
LAADITLETQSEESMLITDVIQNLGKAFQQIRIKNEGLSKKG